MLKFQEVLSICKIEFWCELITILFRENVDHCLGQEYTLTSRLGGKGSIFRRQINVQNKVFDL